MKTNFYVSVEFPGEFAFGDVEHKIDKIFGKNSLGAGMAMFGKPVRDMSALFGSEIEAERAAVEVRKVLKGAGIKEKHFTVDVQQEY